MANPIIQYGGLEGEEIGRWMGREEKRLVVLQRGYNSQLQRQYTIQAQRIAMEKEEEKNPKPQTSPVRRAQQTEVTIKKAAVEEAEREKWEEFRRKMQEKEERVERNRLNELQKKKAQASNQEALQRARKKQEKAEAEVEQAKLRYEESMRNFEQRKTQADKDQAQQDLEYYNVLKERRDKAVKQFQKHQEYKQQLLAEKIEEKNGRFQQFKQTLDKEKEEERSSMLERLQEKRKQTEKELKRRERQFEEQQRIKAQQLAEKEHRAEMRLAEQKEKRQERFKELHEWRKYMEGNIKHSSQEHQAYLSYAQERVRRSQQVSEDLEKRREMVQQQARELHFQQSDARRALKNMAMSNETYLIQHGPLEEKAKLPEMKAMKRIELKPMPVHPLPGMPEIPARKKFVKGKGNPYDMEEQ